MFRNTGRTLTQFNKISQMDSVQYSAFKVRGLKCLAIGGIAGTKEEWTDYVDRQVRGLNVDVDNCYLTEHDRLVRLNLIFYCDLTYDEIDGWFEEV